MKKKRILFVFAIVLVLSAIGIRAVYANRVSARSAVYAKSVLSRQELSWHDNPWESFSAILAKEGKQMAGQRLDADIPVYYEEELLFKTNGNFWLNRDACFYEGTSARQNDSGAIMAAYPTSAIRRRNDDTVYTIYDTDTGYRLYLLFSGENDYVTPVGFPLVVKEKRSYADFSELKIGDAIEQVEQIDPVVGLHKKEIIEVWDLDPKGAAVQAEKGYPCTTIHYLNDGLLKIEYTVLEDQRLIISDMEFNKDYQLVSANGKTVNYRIMAIDLPQNW